MNELAAMFRENFPDAVRSDGSVERITTQNRIIVKRAENGKIAAAAILNEDTIYMLCVGAEYRNKGLAGALLAECEEIIRAQGFGSVKIGAGADYLIPGVPTETGAREFFMKRGYRHAWGEGECFDMSMKLSDFTYDEHKIGDTINGVCYRWANEDDMEDVYRCTDDACPEFTQFYKDISLYREGNSRALIAESEGGVRGALIVGTGTEAPNTGSAGCTAVMQAWRGRHIAANMILLGTRVLKESGCERGFIGYTYSGLEKLYGIAGYEICAKYFMAVKDF